MIEKIENFVRECCYQELMDAAREGRESATIDYQELDRFDPTLGEVLLDAPKRFFTDLEEVMRGLDLGTDGEELTLRFENIPDSKKERIKDLRSEHLSKMVKLEGIVRRASEVMPEVRTAIFECPDCGERHEIRQKREKLTYPDRCACGRKRGFNFVDRVLNDVRYLFFEDHFESTVGERPGDIKVVLKGDLTTPEMQKRSDPGTRLEITGVLDEVPKKVDGRKSKQMDMVLKANHIQTVEEEFDEVEIDEETQERIEELAENPEVYDIIVDSLAPSMYGLRNIKEAIALQLFGGVPQTLPDGTQIRGDIHILLVGDPSVGKTQLLQLVSDFMPRGRYVSGKGTSAAGLTATVVKDDEIVGGWVLEAGAIVLSNKSVLAIDEFDKMSQEDQINLHEAMSVQTVTISKATIQTTLPARTAVLAGCNPKFSRFDPGRSVAEQIEIPDTLLSRFDLKFILMDRPSKERDEEVVDHVIQARLEEEEVEPKIDPDFLKKYIVHARMNYHPEMTKKAAAKFKNFFVELRSKQSGENSPVPITLRQYEALMRLAEASARIRLGDKVNEADAQRAIKLMRHSITQLGLDTETGELDIDKAEGGTSASDRNRIRTVVETLEELEETFGKSIPTEEVLAALEDQGIDEVTANKIIREMQHKGMLFEPRAGHLQKI